MESLRQRAAMVRIAVTHMAGELPAMYAQGGFTGILVGTILGTVMYQLRLRGVTLAGGFSQLQ